MFVQAASPFIAFLEASQWRPLKCFWIGGDVSDSNQIESFELLEKSGVDAYILEECCWRVSSRRRQKSINYEAHGKGQGHGVVNSIEGQHKAAVIAGQPSPIVQHVGI